MKSLSRVRLFATPWTVACQAPLSMGFSRQGYWSGLAFSPLGDLPNPGTEPACPSWMGKCFTTDPPEEGLLLSHVRLFATPWTVACQAPLSTGFSRQEYWNGLPFPSPGNLPDPGIEPASPAWQEDSLPPAPPGKPMRRELLILILKIDLLYPRG